MRGKKKIKRRKNRKKRKQREEEKSLVITPGKRDCGWVLTALHICEVQILKQV